MMVTFLIFLISKNTIYFCTYMSILITWMMQYTPITSWDNEGKKAQAPLMSFRSLDINHVL